ncbi:hypothetical protein GJ699_26370 [Duganella sp. FT80W]|uniref:DUF2924 domain-containing protein n=1 Tax=Duganella guangzhouensis TaxID=2666084 RepID=A0A6I2L5T8_9BURK|nr:hypothetical protein [Duganella guangzhouensis]MRW93521.1 hypothetical protein [Duganella guangzhouensis]
MDYQLPVGLRASVFHALCDAVGDFGFSDRTHEAMCEAINEWLERKQATASAPTPSHKQLQPDVVPAESAQHARPGYQWKQLFLPEGTELRVATRGRVRYAVVEGHHIIHNDKPVSPSQFANSGDVVRNAWRVVWLKLPGEAWIRAEQRRNAAGDLVTKD